MAHAGVADVAAVPVLERPLSLSPAPIEVRAEDGPLSPQTLTRQAHRDAIRRIVEQMRRHYSADLTLDDMAEAACFSPYYTNRLFRSLTGLQPRRFLGAIRFDAAKRLLLHSELSVTEICYEVGYSSLGSFTTRFHQGVGVAPRQFRREAATIAAQPLPISPSPVARRPGEAVVLRGACRAEAGYEGLVFLGVFPSPLPEGLPLACTVGRTPGSFELACTGAGRSFLLAVALPRSARLGEGLLAAAAGVRVASVPVDVRSCRRGGVIELGLGLRPLEPTDPPVVTALPLLLERACADQARQA
jgi:AraC family transcriptional regulator